MSSYTSALFFFLFCDRFTSPSLATTMAQLFGGSFEGLVPSDDANLALIDNFDWSAGDDAFLSAIPAGLDDFAAPETTPYADAGDITTFSGSLGGLPDNQSPITPPYAGPSGYMGDVAGPTPPAVAGPCEFQGGFLAFLENLASSSSAPAISSSPHDIESSQPSSPTTGPQQAGESSDHALSPEAQAVYDSLTDSQRQTMGWAPELNRMLTAHPNFIPTFDFKSAMSMTARDVVNPVSGPIPAALAFDHPELVALRQTLQITAYTTIQDFAREGTAVLDMVARHPNVSEALEQYRYQPEVEGETISTILPKVGAQLEAKPDVLDFYQVPLWPGEETTAADEDEQDPDTVDASEDDADDEDEDPTPARNKDKKKKTSPKKLENKYRPRAVQYGPYRYRFKSSEEASAHRKAPRHPAKIARDVDRVEKYGRYYWTKRIYEAIINVDLIFDNRASVIATNISKTKHFNEDDLEATAHHIFDACIKVHRRGWCGYDYNRKDFKRGKLKDVFGESIEARLERICGILKHSKAIANDCIQGGDVLQQTVYNPIYRASTKTANNKGNLDRAGRLAKQETDLQREKREKREAEKAAREAEKERKRVEREAKKAEREAEKQRKQDERAAAQAARVAARGGR